MVISKKVFFLIFILVFFTFVVYAQPDSKGKICFYFVDQCGNHIKPNVEIIDIAGNLSKLDSDYCLDYFAPFNIKVLNRSYYDFQKMYRMPMPETDTIYLRNITTMANFFVKSETPTLTNDNITFLNKIFMDSAYSFISLSLEIIVGKYDIRDFQDVIKKIYDLYFSGFMHKGCSNKFDFSVSFKKDSLNMDNVLYLFNGERINL
jgi:hypothetical protein